MNAMEGLSEEAKKNVKIWIQGPYDLATKKEIEKMVATDVDGTENAFYTHLSFGTGGMRGLMGVGPNRMNIYTVRQTTKGLANYLKKVSPSHFHRVAIGFDSRHNSQLFAMEAAKVLAASSIESFLFSQLRPTPLVSFVCRHLKCSAAIMITASHNPPEYNGYKVYWSDGGQVLPPHDEGIMREVAAISPSSFINVSPEDDPYIHVIRTEEDEEYFKAIAPLALWPATDKRDIAVVYSPLHGTGGTLIARALRQVGVTSLHVVAPQMIADGSFPTAKRPNPEERDALELGIQMMMDDRHDIFLATDPDADRLGCVVNHQSNPHILTGNQIAALATEWIFQRLSQRNLLPPRPAVVKTIVTTPLISKIAARWGAACFDVLTGFKYIARLMNSWESDPNGYSFIFGCEESYGSLYGTHARDKDAIVAACLLSEIAWHLKRNGKTLVDGLHDLWSTYGYFDESLHTYAFGETKSGRDNMTSVMERLRTSPPSQFAGLACLAFEDLRERAFKGSLELRVGKDLPVSDVLIFSLDGGSRVIVRPSGTEPKVKVYCMLAASPTSSLDVAMKETGKLAGRLKEAIGGIFTS